MECYQDEHNKKFGEEKMKTNKILISVVLSGMLLLTGCTAANTNEILNQPSAKVQMMIEKNNLQIVDYDYVKKAIAKGSRNSVSAILIDARPEAKYKKSTIPSSLNIPDTKFEEYYSQIKDLQKDKELIVFCGGWNCGKSPKVASMLKAKGFTNVKLYQAGEPEWIKKDYIEIDSIVVKAAIENNSALIVDARPYPKFMQESIIGAISIPDTQLAKYIGRFPSNKEEKIIVFCGGYNCAKSHIVANKLVSLGYKNVAVYAAGLPGWKAENLPTTKGGKFANEAKVEKVGFSKNGLKLGRDEGTVDGEWFTKLVKENKVPTYVQIVDVTAPNEYAKGHLKGAMNIEAEKFSAKDLYAKLPKNKTVVFNCTAGGRSTDAWTKLKEAKLDVSEIYIFDANIDCKGTNCKVEPNEPLE